MPFDYRNFQQKHRRYRGSKGNRHPPNYHAKGKQSIQQKNKYSTLFSSSFILNYYYPKLFLLLICYAILSRFIAVNLWINGKLKAFKAPNQSCRSRFLFLESYDLVNLQFFCFTMCFKLSTHSNKNVTLRFTNSLSMTNG